MHQPPAVNAGHLDEPESDAVVCRYQSLCLAPVEECPAKKRVLRLEAAAASRNVANNTRAFLLNSKVRNLIRSHVGSPEKAAASRISRAEDERLERSEQSPVHHLNRDFIEWRLNACQDRGRNNRITDHGEPFQSSGTDKPSRLTPVNKGDGLAHGCSVFVRGSWPVICPKKSCLVNSSTQ